MKNAHAQSPPSSLPSFPFETADERKAEWSLRVGKCREEGGDCGDIWGKGIFYRFVFCGPLGTHIEFGFDGYLVILISKYIQLFIYKQT